MNSCMWATVNLTKDGGDFGTHHQQCGSAEDSEDLRNGAGTGQQPQIP